MGLRGGGGGGGDGGGGGGGGELVVLWMFGEAHPSKFGTPPRPLMW